MNDASSTLSSLACLGIPLLLLFGFLWLWGRGQEETRKRLRAAQDAYQGSLAELKTNPTNADLKQRTLELGRKYSALTRENKAVTVFDEVALGNDINAATAGATVMQTSPVARTQSDVAERLQRLDQLKAQGVISEAEHSTRRAEILKDI